MIKKYDASKIAEKIGTYYDGGVYRNVQDRIIEETQSCDLEEATSWMVWYMKDALANGCGERNEELRCQFLAAYDIWRNLTNLTKLELVVWKW